MEEILTRDEILEGYPKLEDIDALFDADILILPGDKAGDSDFVDQLELSGIETLSGIEREFQNINVKYYCSTQPKLYEKVYNQAPLGLISIDIPGVIVLLSSLSVQFFLKYLYNFSKNSIINIDIFRKYGDKGYVRILFKNNLGNTVDGIQGNTVEDLQRQIEELEKKLNEKSM